MFFFLFLHSISIILNKLHCISAYPKTKTSFFFLFLRSISIILAASQQRQKCFLPLAFELHKICSNFADGIIINEKF